MSLYYRRNGKPYPEGPSGLKAFCKDLESDRRVGFDRLKNGIDVSTVWLGINHQHGKGRPLIFESMVFVDGRGGGFDVFRYSTEEEARLGHKMLVKKWSKLKTVQQLMGG